MLPLACPCRSEVPCRRSAVVRHRSGSSTSRAFRIYKTYGNEAIEKVGRPLPPGPRHPGHRLQDRRPDRREAGHRQAVRPAGQGRRRVRPAGTDRGRPLRLSAVTDWSRRPSTMLEIPRRDHRDGRGLHGWPKAAGRRERRRRASRCLPGGAMSAERRLAESLIALTRGNHPCPQSTWRRPSLGRGQDRLPAGGGAAGGDPAGLTSRRCWSSPAAPAWARRRIVNAIVQDPAGQEAGGGAVRPHRPGRQAHEPRRPAARPRPSTGCWSSTPRRPVQAQRRATRWKATCSSSTRPAWWT